MPRGHSLPELLIALSVIAILLGIAVPRLSTAGDRAAVRGATVELVAMLASTRRAALLRSTTVALVLDAPRVTATVVAGADTLLSRPLGAELGVRLTSTRDTIRYGPSGRGYGASNATIILSRGSATDTLWVSRLGRAK